MKFYQVSDKWVEAIPEKGVAVVVYFQNGITESSPAILPNTSGLLLGPTIGKEITKEEFISIFNKTIKQYENYFESEGNNQVG